MDKRAIARIVVGQGRGTGFLVSRDGLVLTALHVVADLEGSRRNERLKPYPDPITLRFGDPLTGATWTPTGAATLVPELYSLQGDWAVLKIAGPIPGDVVPLRLAELATAHDTATWKTYGFPDVAAAVGSDFDGPITSWDQGVARLRSDAAAGVKMSGISGSPCIVGGDAVALIHSALLDKELCQGGVLTAIRVREIAAAAAGRLPFSQPVLVPFEHRVRALLPRDDEALREAARLLGIPERPTPSDVARGLVLAGVARAGAILWQIALPEAVCHEVLDMVAAAHIHHEAVDRLVEAVRSSVPGVMRATAPETCNWYGLRARHKLTDAGDATPASRVWGKRLLHVDIAGREESAAPDAGADPIRAAADQLIALIRKAATGQWQDPRVVRDALDGKLTAPFCVALHGELRVPVVDELRRRLPNARFLMVCAGEIILGEADRARVVTIAPHLENESDLLASYLAIRTA